MTTGMELANRLFPHVTGTPEEIRQLYPPRKLQPGARVTRFAPSPTGFVTIGSLYATFISERLAHQSGGIFYLRIEDTDKKREVAGSLTDMLLTLAQFGIQVDEGPTLDQGEAGSYGPYTQSSRVHLYQVFVKRLIEQGLAYPCFCSAEELQHIREQQQAQGVTTGYYGSWAVHRNLDSDRVLQELQAGKPYVIRLRSPGNPEGRMTYTDLVKGVIQMPENVQDVVIMKSDGVPTYHFAHVIDDYLMGTTHVIRGDEWLSSIPIHHQLFDMLGFPKPEYGHIAPIMKMDGSSKRKFSKRKDPDAAASYYRVNGYPSLAIREYFMTLINAGFDEWRLRHPAEPYDRYQADLSKMSVSGALFDPHKLNDISKETIARMEAEEVLRLLLQWAAEYDAPFYEKLNADHRYVLQVLGIGRSGEKPRKDLTKWPDFKTAYGFMFEEAGTYPEEAERLLPDHVSVSLSRQLVGGFLSRYAADDDRDQWFGNIQELAACHGFAANLKLYKKNPADYAGHVADVAAVIRLALTGRTQAPDLFDVMQAMGTEQVVNRLKAWVARV